MGLLLRKSVRLQNWKCVRKSREDTLETCQEATIVPGYAHHIQYTESHAIPSSYMALTNLVFQRRLTPK
jgi:hypothetical protein